MLIVLKRPLYRYLEGVSIGIWISNFLGMCQEVLSSRCEKDTAGSFLISAQHPLFWTSLHVYLLSAFSASLNLKSVLSLYFEMSDPISCLNQEEVKPSSDEISPR